jgi:ferredoxin
VTFDCGALYCKACHEVCPMSDLTHDAPAPSDAIRITAEHICELVVAPTMPVVSLNGSGKDNLLDQQRAVGEALEALTTTLRAAWPHGRDYATGSDLREAIAWYGARLAVIEDMERASMDVVMHLHETGGA